MKRCVICGEMKDESEFYVRHRNKDGTINLRGECKVCHSNREMQRYYEKQAFIDAHKLPCAKCGEERIRCIAFHHTDPELKDFTIAQNRKTNYKVIEREINKCICLCLNCHHEFHYLQSINGISLEEYLKQDKDLAS